MLIYLSILETEEEKMAFQEVYENNYLKMYHVALGLLHNKMKAEDAVHSAFLKIVEKYSQYFTLSSSEMTSLCVIITKNKSLDMLRKDKNILFDTEESWESEMKTDDQIVLNGVLKKEEDKMLTEALAQLSETLRSVLELKYYHDYSNAEIADILDISKKTVEMRLYRAKEMLRKVLEDGSKQ